MARNYVTLEQVINDFVLTIDHDDYASSASDVAIRNTALRGIREMGFDLSKTIRSIKLPVDTTNNTVELPEDYVDWTKVGVVSNEGIIYVLSENKNINYSQTYILDSDGDKIDDDSDGVYERTDSKSATVSGSPANNSTVQDGIESFVFRNYIYDTDLGALYGIGGGHNYGQFRVNLDQNRLEIDSSGSVLEIVMEYVADEALSSNPRIHVYIEEALRSYIYYKIIEKKASVPANEKARARQEYYNERRKASARMNAITKEDILRVIRKNFKQSPKY